MKQIKNKLSSQSKGQAMAEFALTIPVFFMLIFGVIELSRYFLVYSSIFTATREATRYGSSVGDASLPNYQNCEMIAETAVRMGNFGGVQTNDISIFYESEPGTWVADCDPAVDPEDRYQPVLGDRVVVEIDTDFDSILGVVPDMMISAENGRTIMLGVLKQGSVILNEEPTEEPTEEIICPTGNIIVDGSPSVNNGQQTITVNLKNNTGEQYKMNYFNTIQWTPTNRQLTSLNYKGSNLISISYESPTGKIYPGQVSTLMNASESVPVVFTFSDKTKDMSISFSINFSKPDGTCSKTLDYP